MNSKAIRMKIKSTRYEMGELLFSRMSAELAGELEISVPEELANGAGEDMEINTDGLLTEENGRIELSYKESELTGMDGSTTAISFSTDTPSLISMVREGSVSTALVFEQGKRHRCAYNTPYMPFEICVHTLKVDNRLATEKTIFIDYIIEIRGARAERTKMEITYFE